MKQSGTSQALALGCWSTVREDPLGIAEVLEMAEKIPEVKVVGVANPSPQDEEHFQRVEQILKTGRVRALKIYLGYLPFGPEHETYRTYYELAERYRLPIIFHTGHTRSPVAKLKYSHPLLVDEIAVDYPDVRFVLTQVGQPWMMDAAEVIAKNLNVWTIIAGINVPRGSLAEEERKDLRSDNRKSLMRAFRYAERPNRFLYGSDWPLVSMCEARGFVRETFPETYHSLIFEENSQMLFRL